MSNGSKRRGKVRNEGGTVDSIWRRDGRKCWLCKHGVSVDDASRDHVQPQLTGGYNKARNYRLAHRQCNTARGALPIRETLAVLSTLTDRTTTNGACDALRRAYVDWMRTVNL